MKKPENTVKKILGEPFVNEFPDYVRKIRNSLIFVSSIAIMFYWSEVKLSSSSTLFGLKFENLNNDDLAIALLIFNFYFFIHFLWCAIHNFYEWRIRLSGTKLAYSTAAGFASEEADYNGDLRQSTLYNWWLNKTKLIDKNHKVHQEIEEQLKNIKAEIQEKEISDNKMTEVNASIRALSSNVDILLRNIENLSNIETSPRIKVSLERFDKWYRTILKSQNLRWIFFELSLPVFLGAYALCIQLINI